MNIKLHIPNLLTAGNLFCGVFGLQQVFAGNLLYGSLLIGAAAFFDFLDGFAARLLKANTPLGKQLDSLADMVSFGVLPGAIAFQLAAISLTENGGASWIKYLAYAIPILSAFRLAKFNIDERQTSTFIGLPTPANAIFWGSLTVIGSNVFNGVLSANYFAQLISKLWLNNSLIIPIAVLFMSLLLLAEIPMFSLKFENYGWNKNKLRYSFLLGGTAFFILVGFAALPIIILLYVLLGVANNLNKTT